MLSRHVSRVIHAAPAAVVAFASDPRNLPRWAAGLAAGDVRVDGETLTVDSPMGEVMVRFAPPNDLGVLDHDVRLPSGEVVTNPMRVIAHPDGSEVVFTIRQRDLSDTELERDAAAVERDLARLANILEARR